MLDLHTTLLNHNFRKAFPEIKLIIYWANKDVRRIHDDIALGNFNGYLIINVQFILVFICCWIEKYLKTLQAFNIFLYYT